MQAINLTSIYIANLIAVVMIGAMFLDSRGRTLPGRAENRLVNLMIVTAVTACVTDPLTFAFDGKAGMAGWFFAFWGNGLLFCLNMVIGPLWSVLVIHHVRGVLYRFEKILIIVPCAIGFGLILINLFVPIIYHVDICNVYHRDQFYWYYVAMEMFFLIYGCIVYFRAKAKGGVLKFFPLINFVVPIVIGIAVQSVFYGVSTIPSFMTVSICCMINSLQKESIYRDPLTGIYNRAYLDYIKQENMKKNGSIITAIMIDLNGFKSINDRFGHSAGDQALIDFAEILQKEIGEIGSVIRYAGDEFVILLNTGKNDIVQSYIDRIKEGTDEFNKINMRQYSLSFALGSYSIDLHEKSVEELMNEVDKEMYKNKSEFYANNPQLNRRR